VRQLIPALVVTVAVFSTAHADPPKASPFSNKSFGDGGGYKHPDAAVGDYFETKPEKPAELKPERPQAPAKVTPEIQPIAAVPSRPRPRPFAPVLVKNAAAPVAAAKAKTVSAPAGSIAAEKTGPAVKTPAAASAAGGDDSASEDARRDYEARLLGAAPAPRRQGLADSQPLPSSDPAASASTGEGMLFVSLELDAREAGSLRDAVAGLGSAAAFRPDARFQPLPGEAGSVRISGWLPASRLGDAISRPGVKRVSVERGSRPAGDDRVTGDYLLKLRVTDSAHPEEAIAESVRELTSATGFKLDRVFGFETVPGGAATALVSGTMPVSRLSRALALADVIKVSSPFPAEAAAAAPAAEPVKKEGFLRFVMNRSLWLVLLTLLLALTTMGEAVKSGLAVFVPYR
jgi:hypothetical protein